MSDRLIWERDGRDWPNRSASRFVSAAGLRWHVQQFGTGPVALLVHGTGASTHSWRGLAPILAESFSVVAPDLPGHGFTEAPAADRMSLPRMAGALNRLLLALELTPSIVVGHSAGAAILVRMCLDGDIEPKVVVSLNGALLPLDGLPGHLFSPVAKLLAQTSVAARLFAWRAGDPAVVERLMRDTGSTLEPEDVDLYRRLARSPGHVNAALAMMANWDLRPLRRALPRLQAPLVLVAADNDRTVPPSNADRVRALMPDAKVVSLYGLGHLAHEERPADVADLIRREAAEAGVR